MEREIADEDHALSIHPVAMLFGCLAWSLAIIVAAGGLYLLNIATMGGMNL